MSNLYIDLENKLKLESSVSARSRIARREQAAAQVSGLKFFGHFRTSKIFKLFRLFKRSNKITKTYE